MKTIQLDKGINLHHIKTDKFKSITICILFRQQLNKKTSTINSLIPNVLQRGCLNYDSMSKISAKKESMYGSQFSAQIVKKGEEQIIQFYLDFIRSDDNNLLIEGLSFLNEVIYNPLVKNYAFNEQYVETEKQNLYKVIKSRVNNKNEYSKLRCIQEMCKEESFGVYADGYLEDIETITPKNLYLQYKQIIETSPVEFIVLGDAEEEVLKKSINQIFNFKRNNINYLLQPSHVYNKKEAAVIKEYQKINQANLCLGLRSDIKVNSDDYYKLILFNELLGGTAVSRLFVKIREKENLCYYITSFVFRFKSIILIQTGMEAVYFDKVVELIKAEIKEMVNGKISEEEINNCKNNIIKKYQSIKDYPSYIMDFYMSLVILNNEDFLDDIIKKVNKISISDIIKVAHGIYIDTVYLLSSEGVDYANCEKK